MIVLIRNSSDFLIVDINSNQSQRRGSISARDALENAKSAEQSADGVGLEILLDAI